jgi:transposase
MRALDPEVVDAVWAAVEPRLPSPPVDDHPLGCHRARIPDRGCFEGILIRLVTGCAWVDVEQIMGGCVSDTTLRDRRDEWIRAGVFDRLADEAVAGYDRVIGLDLSECSVDGSQHKAPLGGEGTGPSPVDRGKRGWKWSLCADRHGIPLGWIADGANRNDCVLLEPTLDAVAERDCSPSVRRCTPTVATTTASSAALSQVLASTISSAPKSVPAEPPRRTRSCRSDCAGRLNAPTHGCRTSVSFAATPIGSPSTASPNSLSPSRFYSQPSSSTGETDGPHERPIRSASNH